MERFLFPVLALLISISAFAMDDSSENQEPHCSDWIFRASSEEYAAAFDRWTELVERSQAYVIMAKEMLGRGETPFAHEQLKATQLATEWYNALIHLGGLAAIEKISEKTKIRAIQRATQQLQLQFPEGVATVSLNLPIAELDVSALPEAVRECYSWMTFSFGHGLPTGGFQNYLKALGELSHTGS